MAKTDEPILEEMNAKRIAEIEKKHQREMEALQNQIQLLNIFLLQHNS